MTTLHERHIAQLWVKLAQLYGHRWASAYGDRDVDNIWLRALQGLTPQHLGAGLEAITRSGEAWPPTAPEFRRICEEAVLRDANLPSPSEAWAEVAAHAYHPHRHRWSHPAVYVAGRETCWFDIKHSDPRDPKDQTEARFLRNYQVVTRRVLSGEQLDAEIPLALEDTRGKRRSLTERDKEAGREALEALKGSPEDLERYLATVEQGDRS